MDHKTTALIVAFNNAFNRHDLDAIMEYMTEDCIFYAPFGDTTDGTQYRGAAQVRVAISAMFQEFPDAYWHPIGVMGTDDCVVTKWTFTGTSRNGVSIEVNGCDILTIRAEKIAVKDAFRKQRAVA